MLPVAHECYRELGQSEVIQSYFNQVKDSLSFGKHIGWDASPLDIDIILKEPILNEINKKFKIKQGGILKTNPFRCYNWHEDIDRGVSINLLLTPLVNSITLFGNSVSEEQLAIHQLIYKPNTFYLFNTQIPHTVINFEECRFLFSVEFELNKSHLLFSSIPPT